MLTAMSAIPVQCECGQVIVVPVGRPGDGVRCPSCGAIVRAKSSGRRRRESGSDEARSADATRREADAEDFEESGGEYGVVPEPEADRGMHKGGAGQSVEPTWVPTRGREPESMGLKKSARRASGAAGESADLLQRIRKTVELPGPFFKWSALVYPLLHPNWIRWLGLSFMTVLAAGAVSVSVFVAWIVIQFNLFLSIFTMSSMGLVCIALVSHVVASFVEVIEETAAGEDRLERTMDFSWWDMLPRFMQALGAAAVAAVLTYAVTYPLRRWFPWDAPELILIQSILMYQLFPILLITNLVDGSWFPLKSLPATLRRLAACVGYLFAFWMITIPVALAVDAALTVSFRFHIAAGIFAAGPLLAAWLQFYGHWLGRLARQLADVE
jgi:hypothetical protein